MIAYKQKMRELAKEKQRPLVTLSFDCRHIRGGLGETIEYQGLGDDELLKAICSLIASRAEVLPPSPELCRFCEKTPISGNPYDQSCGGPGCIAF